MLRTHENRSNGRLICYFCHFSSVERKKKHQTNLCYSIQINMLLCQKRQSRRKITVKDDSLVVYYYDVDDDDRTIINIYIFFLFNLLQLFDVRFFMLSPFNLFVSKYQMRAQIKIKRGNCIMVRQFNVGWQCKWYRSHFNFWIRIEPMQLEMEAKKKSIL